MKFPLIKFSSKIGLGIGLLTLLVYTISACRHNPGYADSDEVITIGYLLGSAHPSGYPLQMWLTKLFTLLPIPGSIAFRANILNSILMAATVWLIYQIGIIILAWLRTKGEAKNHIEEILAIIVSATGALMLAFSGLFWMYAGLAEKVALTCFLTALTLFAAFKWWDGILKSSKISKTEIAWFLFCSFIAGLGLTHAQTFILIFPGLGLILFWGLKEKNRWKQYNWKIVSLGVLMFAVAFFGINLSLFYLNNRQQNVSWYFEQSWQGWWSHIMRRVYSGYIPEKDIQVNSYIGKIDFGRYIKAFPFYWQFITDHFTLLGTILGLLGLSWTWLRHKKLASVINSLLLISSMALALYMGVPDPAVNSLEYRSLLGISHRQFLLGETTWGIAIILGLWGGLTMLREFKNKVWHKHIQLVTLLGGIALTVFVFTSNFTMGYQANNSHAHDYAKAVLEPLPQDAILMCFADFSCFALMHAQEVEGFRTDIKLVSKNIYIKGHWLRKNTWIKGLEDTDNPYFSADIISWNLYQGRRVFTTDSVGYYVSYIGLEGNPFFIIPNGYTFEIVKKIPATIPSFNYDVTEKLLVYHRPEEDFWFAGQKDYFSNFHTINALVYSYLGLKDDAMKNIRLSLALTPDYVTAQNIFRELPSYAGNPNYRLNQESSPSAYYLAQAKQLIASKQLDPAYKNLQKATFLDPKDIEARSLMAELLVSGKFYPMARMEYKNLLRFYPDDEKLKARLEQINKL